MITLTLNLDSARSMLPKRDPYGHKGTFGKVLLLCGSRGYTGAAYFASMGALRSGTGLVFLGVPRSIYDIEAAKLNEPVIFPLPEEKGALSEAAIPLILKWLTQVDAVLLGCGLGLTEGAEAVTEAVISHAECPLILDADGITLAGRHKDILRRRTAATILTPHDGEFLRLGGVLGKDRMAAAAEMSRDLNSIVLLKGHRTCITDGYARYCNETGNSGMAAGGSGDLLSGILAGLLGQGMDPLEATACAAFFHGAAGDAAAAELGEYGMLPSDMLNFLPRLLR